MENVIAQRVAVRCIVWLGLWRVSSSIFGNESLPTTPGNVTYEMGIAITNPTIWKNAGHLWQRHAARA